jgi:hypothetical protein
MAHDTRLWRDTKRTQVLAMLSRSEGANGPQIAAAMGWAPHTVRGFRASAGKKGITIEVLERVRQVGPSKTGAKGSYSVYRVVAGAEGEDDALNYSYQALQHCHS